MDVRDLKYFLEVAKRQNLTKAAEQLYITQPSLTRQIQNLEREVGSPLFERTGKKMVLTQTGLLLRTRAEEIVSLFEKTQAELHPDSDEPSGEIYIGGGETYAFKSVAEAMRDTHEKYPKITFNIYSGNTEDVKERLDKGLIDFAVIVEPCDMSGYDFLRLPLADVWGVLTRCDSPIANRSTITVDELEGLPMIVSRHFNSDENEISRIIRRLNKAATYNLIYNASIMVKAGFGHCLCIDKLVNTEGTDLRFIPLEPTTVSFIDLAWKKNQQLTPAANIFLRTLQSDIIHY